MHCAFEQTKPMFFNTLSAFTRAHTHPLNVLSLTAGSGLSINFFKGLLFAKLKFHHGFSGLNGRWLFEKPLVS